MKASYVWVILVILAFLFSYGGYLMWHKEQKEELKVGTTRTGFNSTAVDMDWKKQPTYHLEIYATSPQEDRFCFVRLHKDGIFIGAIYFSKDDEIVFKGDAIEFKKGFVEAMERYIGFSASK